TEDPVLIGVCDQIISDEDSHVEFQMERIASLRSSASPLRRKFSELLQRFLFAGTIAVVWVQHRPVFVRAGFGYASYRKECWGYYLKAEHRLSMPCTEPVALIPEKQVL
ncbi:MAG TPA: hypothetical protein VGE67_07520, partial [Haloferula sp.]